MNILTMDLADIGRWVASKTADTCIARVGQSSAPQLRYDAVMSDILRNPKHVPAFTDKERAALTARIQDKAKRRGVKTYSEAMFTTGGGDVCSSLIS